ncbi:MAG: hypothetical protein WBA99_18830 [Nodosilinea sp.]
MATLTFQKLGRIVAIAVLCLSLWSCGLVNPRPPRAVVEMAIAQKLSQTQAMLYRQLDAAVDPADLAQVGRIRITDHHRITLGQQSAVEVVGIYHLTGGPLTGAQRRQTRPFDLYLQRNDGNDQWLLLEPVLGRSGEVLRWQSTPLLEPNPASTG